MWKYLKEQILVPRVIIGLLLAIVFLCVMIIAHAGPIVSEGPIDMAQAGCSPGSGAPLVSGSGGIACGSWPASGLQLYNSSGLISSPKLWIGTATVNSSGNWSVSVSSAGFTTITGYQFSIVSASNSGLATITSGSCTTSTCSGTANGALNVLGVLTLALTNISGSTVSVQVLGT